MPHDGTSTPRTQDRSFLARYGATILRGGIASIPTALFHYQREVGLSAQQVWFVSAILSYKWDADLPYPSLHKLAEDSGISRQQLHRYERELVEKGLLVVIHRHTQDGARTSNAYDFEPLLGRLEDLLDRDKPAPSNTGATIPSNTQAPILVTPMLHEEEPRKKKEAKKQGSRHVDWPDEVVGPKVDPEEAETIAAYVDDLRRQLGDESGQPRALGQVLNLYARSGVSLERFLVEVYDARKAAQKKVGAENRWAYWYKVLEDRLRA